MAKLSREQFVKYFSDFLREHLLTNLPCEDEEIEMLIKAKQILFDNIAHIQAGIKDPHSGNPGTWP